MGFNLDDYEPVAARLGHSPFSKTVWSRDIKRSFGVSQ